MNNNFVKLYTLLPFRFTRFNKNEVFISNECGEYTFISNDNFRQLTDFNLDVNSDIFLNLKGKQIVTDTEVAPMVDMLATKYRTKKSFLNDFTSLHMIVPTLKCNSSCKYCQVSRKDVTAKGCTMNKATARKIVDLIFK